MNIPHIWQQNRGLSVVGCVRSDWWIVCVRARLCLDRVSRVGDVGVDVKVESVSSPESVSSRESSFESGRESGREGVVSRACASCCLARLRESSEVSRPARGTVSGVSSGCMLCPVCPVLRGVL